MSKSCKVSRSRPNDRVREVAKANVAVAAEKRNPKVKTKLPMPEWASCQTDLDRSVVLFFDATNAFQN